MSKTNFLPPSLPIPIPGSATRLSDNTRGPNEKTRDDGKTKEGDKGGSLRADANNTGLFQRLPDTSEGGGNTGSNTGGNTGGGNTEIANAISDLSPTGIQRVSVDVVNRLTGRKPVMEIGGVGDVIRGASTFGVGSLNGNREKWVSMNGSTMGERPTVFAPVSTENATLIANNLNAARINSHSVNPLAVLREKALGGG